MSTVKRTQDQATRFSIGSLYEIIRQQDQHMGDSLARKQKILYDLKKDISLSSKKNFTLERDIRNLDQKIALLIRNRITLEEVMATSGDILEVFARTTTLKNKKEREQYGQLFDLLQKDTKYIALLARVVKLGEIDNLLQTVMFTLYGNQYDDSEEHLLLSMFQRVLRDEFDQATGLGSLLRANTALTRMMTTYTRRGPGQTYLKATLTDVLVPLSKDRDLQLEINPSKVYEQYINDYESRTGQQCPLSKKATPEEAAANPDVQAIIKPRLQKLDELATSFIKTIMRSVDQVPYGIRWICRQIRELSKAKFPEATREQVCSLIGGFFLLRFINPAIVTPQAFLHVENKLSANARRNQTLLAKILQNLANNMQFGGVKEFFMAPLNSFLATQRENLNEFLEALTRVDNLSEHLSLDKYLALGKTNDQSIHITLNEMYSVHSLLTEHLDIVCVDPSDPLRRVLNELGPAPPQLPRKENAHTDLTLINVFVESDDVINSMTPEQVYTETKYLLYITLRATSKLPPAGGELTVTLAAAFEHAERMHDADLRHKVTRIMDNCKRLVEHKILNEEDNYALLRRDVVQELLDHEEQSSKTSKDQEVLERVHTNILEHNQFLQQQYEAYKTYLSNVRSNCADTTTGTKKAGVSAKPVKKGPFKFSHMQLQKDGVIVESEVPPERQANIYFSFSSSSPGIFTVTVMYKTRSISEMKLQLDDLLERQHNNNLELETDFLKLNVNMLIFVINKTFHSK